ncbi:G-protein coupled receptor 157-like [Sycon ciliatum]|uniref:G-protein coupled receptor 157-like n=1 Tax=Sycon ciliatum TaxID=27933 RepID=UPI0020ADC4AC|eukprot:scpid52584/ scgid28081/ Probable G-protein coupled receptor 157
MGDSNSIPFAPLANATPSPFIGAWPGTLALTCSICSVVGSLLIILTYLAFHDIRSTSRQILAYLSLANLLASASIVWGVSGNLSQDSDSPSCQAQSVLLIATGIADFLWNIGLAVYLYVIITKEGSRWGSNGCPKVLYAACWTPGVVIALVTYLQHHTGVDPGAINTAKWCIIKGPNSTNKVSTNDYVLWSMIVGDGWNILAIFSTLCLYIITKCHLYKETHHHQSTFLTRGALNAAHQIDRKLTFIPITYFFLHIWSFIRTVMAVSRSNINSDMDSWWYKILLGLQTFGDCSEGLANAIIFLVFSPKLRQRLKAAVLAKVYYIFYMCSVKVCCGQAQPEDDEALQRAAGGHYAQGVVNDSAHALLPRPKLSSYHWGNSGSASGRSSPFGLGKSTADSTNSERSQVLPAGNAAHV